MYVPRSRSCMAAAMVTLSLTHRTSKLVVLCVSRKYCTWQGAQANTRTVVLLSYIMYMCARLRPAAQLMSRTMQRPPAACSGCCEVATLPQLRRQTCESLGGEATRLYNSFRCSAFTADRWR